ncbi:S1 domain-containing post-transcriptional regulator GSP13 [Aquisalibacillus elongatus]|uniref:Type II secretion system protein M (GspM) n=1 Tax=Aquisalibacillus elongatus TaxID=485577 RepID=A0A3N5C291_9BACI|nr:S1 domain-containing post-transcriptional regulator GSP13 [Aquisalibacillus elongatus]RPF50291.1 type II secretion system protein M (GspM) [Aquisalibacillus elongatus]
MSKIIEEGQVVEGKVTGIQPYGAFVEIDENVQGLVHISEVTHGYVKDVNDHLSIGDDVKVKVLNVDEDGGKYSLSIRATEEKPNNKKQKQTVAASSSDQEGTGFNVLKDKLEEWIEQSEDREQTYRN